MTKISITIDGKAVTAEAGQSILDVAQEHGIDVPSLCSHPDVDVKHHCGMCVVSIASEEGMKHACSTIVEEGMDIITESADIAEERESNLGKILKKHQMECDDCVWMSRCRLLELTKRLGAKPSMAKDERNKVYQVGTIVFDQTKCIGCENCLAVCPTRFLDMNERGKVEPSTDPKKDCINCGQCIIHCPVGAIEGAGEFEELEKIFAEGDRTVVVQFAPAVRVSIGDEFGLSAGEVATGKLVAGLKAVGFDFVFDTAAGADFTTMEEAGEVVERIAKGERLPIMTSCCPAWVKYVELNYPEFIPNLASSRSPQVMLGGIIKHHWAKEQQLDPKNVFVVSIMPCVAKKFEIRRPELEIDGLRPVDMVLTTRELARLFKKNHIDLKTLEERDADDPLGGCSGAGVIYGTSGGVFESAFRTAYFKLTGTDLPFDGIKEICGLNGVKTKEVTIGERTIRMCVVSGIRNARQVLEALKEHPDMYDAVEVMACPGGCIAGGGQPVPTSRKIAKKRSEGLYTVDDGKTLRRAHENPTIQKMYAEDGFFGTEEMRKKILHTRFAPRKKAVIDELKNSKETL